MPQFIEIMTPKGLRKIGPGQPVFIVAEMSGNHNQDIKRAYKIIDAAAAAGVDAVKLQTYTPDTITIDCDKEYFKIKVNDAWRGRTLYSLYQQAYTPWEWQGELKAYGEAKGLVVFSTPFDETAVDFLEGLNVVLYKVASFEVGDLELLAKIGQTKKPVIMSRGMASIEEIDEALKTLKANGAPVVAVLHCVSSYPAVAEQMNLATIPDIRQRFDCVAGLSDHTLGAVTALTSVALGAAIIEKHFTLKRADGGPDAAFSLEPQEMKELVAAVRQAEKAIGQPTYGAGIGERESKLHRRSLFIVKNIKAGELLTRDNIRSIRPGYGLPPKFISQVLGKKAKYDLARGEPLKAIDYE
jgi:pseudaminic acid synthase